MINTAFIVDLLQDLERRITEGRDSKIGVFKEAQGLDWGEYKKQLKDSRYPDGGERPMNLQIIGINSSKKRSAPVFQYSNA